jgi:hypothetical protein
MTNEFNEERARKTTIEAIDLISKTVVYNRERLAKDILKMYPEASTPAMGPAAVNMALSILALVREHVAHDAELRNAADTPPDSELH